MSANFMPSKNSYKDLGAFRFWCQKVLPMAYDDSLSYYEVLCKITNYINEIIDNMKKMGEDTTELYNAFVSLQDYVNHYFDNLDVQNAINTKLDSMAQTGELSEVIRKAFKEYISPQIYGAKADGVTDDYQAIQRAIDSAVELGIGCVHFPSGSYITSKPIIVKSGVSLVGESRDNTRIIKNTNTTINCEIFTKTFIREVYTPQNLPNNINAVIVLFGSNGRYVGKITELDICGVANEANYDELSVEFGIVSNGTVSDTVITHNYIRYCQYALLIQTIFASEVSNNRIFTCHHGFGFETSTSLSVNSNYCCSCRDYGYYFRNLLYCNITANACDALNRNDYYKNRALSCTAYTFNYCICCTISSNGQEQTLGTNWRFITCIGITFESNMSMGIGSDYSGTEDIAWMYFNNKLQNSCIRNNFAYGYNSLGLVFGNANSNKHHNIYFEDTTYVKHNTFENNMVASTTDGIVTESGWLNNSPSTWLLAGVGGTQIYQNTSPYMRAEVNGDFAFTALEGNKHYKQVVGDIVHVWGCFHGTISYSTASGYFMVYGMPTNNGSMVIIPFTIAVNPSKTKTIGSFRVNVGGEHGIVLTDTGSPFNVTDIPSGSTIQVYYDGWYTSA